MGRLRASALLLLLLCGPACGRPPEATDLWENSAIRRAKESGRLVVALESEFPPMESRDASGNLIGFDVDLARTIARELGDEVVVDFHDVKWDTIQAELTTGKADLIISGMTATPDRALTISFSDPYFETVTWLLVAKRHQGRVKTYRDLDSPDFTIAVKSGTTGVNAARTHLPRAKRVDFPTENAAALEVASGRADAFLYDLASVKRHQAEHRDETFLLEETVSVEPYAIACRKGDPETLAWLNLVLDHMRRDGRMEELYARHGLEAAR
jgi:polar amino acid transport system substrate-binding protein